MAVRIPNQKVVEVNRALASGDPRACAISRAILPGFRVTKIDVHLDMECVATATATIILTEDMIDRLFQNLKELEITGDAPR